MNPFPNLRNKAARWVTWLFGRRNPTPKYNDRGSDLSNDIDHTKGRAQRAEPLPEADEAPGGTITSPPKPKS